MTIDAGTEIGLLGTIGTIAAPIGGIIDIGQTISPDQNATIGDAIIAVGNIRTTADGDVNANADIGGTSLD